MPEHDDEIERLYRALPREEPPARMDAAILAASRDATRRSWTRRWAVPLSAAAMLVLALGITIELQREQPGIETSVPSPASAPEVGKQAPAATPSESAPSAPSGADSNREAKTITPSAPLRAQMPSVPVEGKKRAMQAAPQAEAPASQRSEDAGAAARPSVPSSAPPPTALGVAPAPPPSAATASEPSSDNVSAAKRSLAEPAPKQEERTDRANAGASAMQPSDPRDELERIAKLREAGRNREADRALVDFRRTHPDYRIPDDVWERVKAR